MKYALTIFLLLYAAMWIAVARRAVNHRSWRGVGRCLAYHALVMGSVLMVGPFYWMLASSLKDFQSANQTPPAWLPVGVRYFSPVGVLTSSTVSRQPMEEMEVGLIRDANKSWSQIQSLKEITVAPVDRMNDLAAHAVISPVLLRRERRPHWENYREAWRAPAKGNPQNPVTFTRYFQVSIVTSVVATAGTLFTSILAAYAFARMRFRGRELFFFLVLTTMMVPSQVLLIPNFLILAKLPDWTFGMRWLDNYPALIVPWLASVFSIFLLRQFFITIPEDLWDAAQIDGAGRFRYLWQVIVPLSRPAVITAGIFIFLGEWNSLLWPLIATTSPHMRTLMVGLQAFNDEMNGQFHLLMAASTMAVLPVVILFFIFQRFFVEGIARTGIK